MAKTSVLHMRLEPEIKEQADYILEGLGISTSDAVNIFLRQVILHGGLPFEVKNPRFNAEVEQAFKDSDSGENLHRFNSAEDLF